MNARPLLLLLSCLFLVLTGCSCCKTARTGPAIPAREVMATLSFKGAVPDGRPIYGVEVELQLPGGVTVKADDTGMTLAGVAVASGNAKGAMSMARFTPGAGTTPAQLHMGVISANGIGGGEFATVKFDVEGLPYLAQGIRIIRTKVVGQDSATLPGIDAQLTIRPAAGDR